MAVQGLAVIAIGVNARVGSVGSSGAVRSVSALRLLSLVVGVAVKLVLDLFDE
jgi:hypothetical protein